MIEVENLTKSFGPNRAVDGISFKISSGEVVGFLGPNGAGKTTAMRMITSYLAKDSGSVTVAGYDVAEDSYEVRKNIGYLPESAPLYLDLEVLEHLKFAAAIRKVPGARRMARIKEIVLACGLSEVLTRKVGFLSKGYRQRVGLAQSMIHDPEILILDEPTTGLDPNQIVEIRDLIKSIGIEKTVILSTHILPEVQSTCNRVLIIDKGRIVADGEPEQLASRISGGVSCEVTFKGGTEEIEKALAEAPFIQSFQMKTEDAEQASYTLLGEGKEEIAEKVFHLAVEKKFILTELRREVASLESVFSSLTVGEVEE